MAAINSTCGVAGCDCVATGFALMRLAPGAEAQHGLRASHAMRADDVRAARKVLDLACSFANDRALRLIGEIHTAASQLQAAPATALGAILERAWALCGAAALAGNERLAVLETWLWAAAVTYNPKEFSRLDALKRCSGFFFARDYVAQLVRTLDEGVLLEAPEARAQAA